MEQILGITGGGKWSHYLTYNKQVPYNYIYNIIWGHADWIMMGKGDKHSIAKTSKQTIITK